MTEREQRAFNEALLAWHDANGRDLPWRYEKDPYKIWVSEIMLQQTRAETVVGYYHRFLKAFPTVQALANAPEQQVLKQWEGLGYYSRARNLHKAAQVVTQELGGQFPDSAAGLRKLPGIGEYTAGAVASIAFNRREAAVDGNVIRVLSRVLGIRENMRLPAARKRLSQMAGQMVDEARPGDFNQAMMGLGALICTPRRVDCEQCPVEKWCDARAVGDALELPALPPPVDKRIEHLGVALVMCGQRILVNQRLEPGLLSGMWQFPNFLDAITEPAVRECLEEMGLKALSRARRLTEAKHVFTHRIWKMRGFAFESAEAVSGAGRWVDLEEFRGLPFPVALRAYKELAEQMMEERS